MFEGHPRGADVVLDQHGDLGIAQIDPVERWARCIGGRLQAQPAHLVEGRGVVVEDHEAVLLPVLPAPVHRGELPQARDGLLLQAEIRHQQDLALRRAAETLDLVLEDRADIAVAGHVDDALDRGAGGGDRGGAVAVEVVVGDLDQAQRSGLEG